MGIDLKGLIAQVLTPDVARQLASTVGMDDRQGKTFVDAAIPALVAAFAGALEHPDGAKALSDAVSNSDPNGVEKLRRALVNRDLQPLSDGANALSPVLGQGVRDKLANDLANLVDSPVEATMPALGAVEQVAVAVIGQQDPSLWSDAGSIRSLLGGQTSASPAAMAPSVPEPPAAAPPPPPPPPPPAPPPIARPAESAAPTPVRRAPPPPPPPPPSGSYTWLIVLIIVIILAVGGYYYWKSTQPAAAGFLTPSTEYTLGEFSRAPV